MFDFINNKKIITVLLLCASVFTFAQNGLEKIVVEKYYVANAADEKQADKDAEAAGQPKGMLPAGSVTYRIYADMLPDYKLISVFADELNAHNLSFSTSTFFYNHPKGDNTAVSKKAEIANSLLALDSYLTFGGVCTDSWGIPKEEDNSDANNFTKSAAGILTNSTTEMMFTLTQKDGMIDGEKPIKPSFAGFKSELDVLGNGSVKGDSIVLKDCNIYVIGGVKGPLPATNRVLIAQLTTNSKLNFELNILIQASDGRAEFYVAHDPAVTPTGDNELSIPSLTYPGTHRVELKK